MTPRQPPLHPPIILAAALLRHAGYDVEYPTMSRSSTLIVNVSPNEYVTLYNARGDGILHAAARFIEERC